MTEGAWNNLGLYERETAADLRAAREAFEKSLALRPTYHSPMFNLAILYRAQKDGARARDWLFGRLPPGTRIPGDSAGLVNWYEDKGLSSDALALLERAAREMPGTRPWPGRSASTASSGRTAPGPSRPWAFRAEDFRSRHPELPGSLPDLPRKRQDAIVLLERSLSLKPDQPGAIQSLNILKRGSR